MHWSRSSEAVHAYQRSLLSMQQAFGLVWCEAVRRGCCNCPEYSVYCFECYQLFCSSTDTHQQSSYSLSRLFSLSLSPCRSMLSVSVSTVCLYLCIYLVSGLCLSLAETWRLTNIRWVISKRNRFHLICWRYFYHLIFEFYRVIFKMPDAECRMAFLS